MPVTGLPWAVAGAERSLRLVRIPPPLLAAMAQATAGAALPEVPEKALVTRFLLESRRLWAYRAAQIQRAPEDAIWVTRLIVVAGTVTAVGAAGFHGRPDEKGMVEVGYRVDPECRRRGYARGALEAMLAVAADDVRVRVVRATISPDNNASRALVEDYGFVVVGEQWDDEDGLEIIYEVPA